MPAEPGKPETPDGDGPPDALSRRSRKCQVLFVLGSGVDPGEQAETLAQEFRDEHSGLNFSKAELIVQAADEWPAGDKAAFRKSVSSVVRKWCRDQAASFDQKRLLVTDYEDDQRRRYAVAGYFPRRRSAHTDRSPGDSPVELPATSLTRSESDEDNAAASVGFYPGMIVRARHLLRTLHSQPGKHLLLMAGAAVLLLLIAVSMFVAQREGDVSRSELDPVSEDSDENGESSVDPAEPGPPNFTTGVVRVYTSEPGFSVLVDGEPVRDVTGNFVMTPCAVTAEQGARTITVFREGSFDLSRVVDVTDDSEVVLEPSSDASGGGSEILKAPYLNAEVGKPIALTNLNSTRPEIDPYVTPDRLSIWFVGDRTEGRGIYVANRLSPFHDFDEPRIVSRSADLPATPSITDDSLYIVYAVPEKARLMALARANPLAGFDGKDPLRYSRSLAPTWTSSQMLGNGLRIYWVEETGKGEIRTLTSTRSNRSDDFGQTYKVQLPGVHPCMSRDGLRQYTFDGKVLTRYRRESPTRLFSEDGVIAELDLPGFTHSSHHRQFFVSSDEQWLFYSDDPQQSGDLFMVRLSTGPQWGVAPRGKSIPPRRVEVAAVSEPDPNEPIVPEKPKPKPVDPRSLPLPYTSHWQIFTTLLNNRQYAEAEGLLRNATANPDFSGFAEQLAWDEEDLQSIQTFWSELEKTASEIESGEAVRIGTLRLEVTGFEEGELIGKRGDTEVRKKLIDLSSTELAGIFDGGISKDNRLAQFRYGVLLAYDKQALDRARDQRFENCPDLAATFRERLARRKLVQAVAELDRMNFSQGVAFLKEAKAIAENTPVADEAQKLEEDLYSYVKWRMIGPRKWIVEGNSFAADGERANGSLLASPNEYRNFELSLEWKTLDTLTAQGGVFFHYPGRGELVDLAHKIHLANDAGKGVDQYSSGSLFSEEAPRGNAVKPSGEWNSLSIRVVDKQVTVEINGKKVLEARASKDTVPDRGLVCLDGVAGGITYRRILLSELPD